MNAEALTELRDPLCLSIKKRELLEQYCSCILYLSSNQLRNHRHAATSCEGAKEDSTRICEYYDGFGLMNERIGYSLVHAEESSRNRSTSHVHRVAT